jgi:hypothetical protein
MNCYNCQDLLTNENISEEHVINNSIGGRLKSKNLLCIKCNTNFGSTIDKELEKQLSIVVDLLGIDRERSKDNVRIEMKTLNGKTKNVGKKMRPHDTLSFELPDGKKIILTTDDPVKYEKLKKSKEAELLNRFNSIKYTEGIEEPTSEKFYFNNYLTDKIGMFATGGPDYFRAIAKIALNYYLY